MTIFNGKIHYKWPFSIAMLVYQRVDLIGFDRRTSSWFSSMDHVWPARKKSVLDCAGLFTKIFLGKQHTRTGPLQSTICIDQRSSYVLFLESFSGVRHHFLVLNFQPPKKVMLIWEIGADSFRSNTTFNALDRIWSRLYSSCNFQHFKYIWWWCSLISKVPKYSPFCPV